MKNNFLKSIFFWLSLTVFMPSVCFSFGISFNYQNSLTNCLPPNSQPSNIDFVNIYSTSFFTSFNGNNSDGYLAFISTSSTLNSSPISGSVYTIGGTMGNATVVSNSNSTSFGVYGLNPNTSYYIFVFSYNNIGCNNGPSYNTNAPLIGSVTTSTSPSDLPLSQPTNLVFNTSTFNSISGSFTPSLNYNSLVLMTTSNTLTATPVDNCNYIVGNKIGNAQVISTGVGSSFTANGLEPNTVYYFYIFSYRNASCNCGNVYRTNSPLTGNSQTLPFYCTSPTSQPTNLVFSNNTNNSITTTFVATNADEYLVVYSSSSSLVNMPSNGVLYNAGNTIGNGTVLYRGPNTHCIATNLVAGSTYYFKIFSLNNLNCSGGPKYNISNPLTGNVTISSASLNYYYGNFHSHSEYSDGSGIPSNDFAYAEAANCMDFLGISEHNHVSAGMSLNNWILGKAQAQASTTSTFLALYGMEWGVISGGGHVVVYGVPNLLGWDPGQYQTYVAKNDYTGTSGLFSTINSFGSNAFATLAHPNNSDFNGIMSTYSSVADDAIVGTAVENGPSTSTNTTYSDPPASMAYLSYYRNMLAKGYRLGPTIDHDNHNITHGRTWTSRTVVLADSLTENKILNAMRKMRFYASEDCSAQVNFKINDNPLGSTIIAAGAPTITVTATTSNPITSLKVYSGIPGSGINATILTSTTTNTINFTHTALSNTTTRYYYIDITESDGKRIITSPIWYTRNDSQ